MVEVTPAQQPQVENNLKATQGCNAWLLYVGVSKKRDTPKWMVYEGKPYFLMDDLGYHYFQKHPCIAMFLLHWLAWPVHLTHLTVNVCKRVSVTTIPTKPASQMPVTPHFNGKESTWFEESTHQQNFFNLPMKRTHKFRKRYIQVVSKSSVVSVARKNSYSQTVRSWT